MDWLTLVVFLMVGFQIWAGFSGGVEAMVLQWPLSCHREGVLGGEIWTLLSYALVHAGWFHLGLNTWGLWLFGGRMFRYVGGLESLKTFALGVFAGGLCHLMVDWYLAGKGQPEIWLVGMSGGVLALWICLTILSPEARLWPTPIRGKALRYGIFISLIWLLWYQLKLPPFGGIADAELAGQATANQASGGAENNPIVSHACHFGGALAGLWMGRRFLGKTLTKADLERARAKREAREEE